ncbi:MAG: phosphate ABC transporter permease PstA [Clostridia bacterium]|nr:phosphate ABC transporter permease PstA [Clostridia bacterium]NCC75724.1 phosphate ABC transporter permease PstA [Clostridia bacterium]
MMRLNPKTTQFLAKGVIWGSALLVIVLLLFILLFVLIKGVPTLSWQFLTENPRDMGRSGGIFSTIVSTILVTLVSVAVATPFGVGTALYLTEFTREGLATRIIRFSADTLAAIPSIVYGLFGFIFFVINLNMGWSILSGGLTMAMMILPTIIRTSEEAILAIHPLYREVSFSLGGTKMQTILGAVLPSALRGIMTGVILSIGRCVAETAAVILTAGSSLRLPESVFSPARTMAVHFYILVREGISMERAYGTAAALILLILIINFGANMLINRFVAKNH